MITPAQCDTYLSECRALGTAPDISIKRATAIMAICRAWSVLRQQVVRYDAIVEEESRLASAHRAK